MIKIFSNFRNVDTDPLFSYLRNKFKTAPITIFYEYIPNSIEELKINPYNFLILLEPNEFFGLHDIAIKLQDHFTAILSWSDIIQNNCNNGILFTFNGRVLDDVFINSIKDKEKNFEVSFLCGDKNITDGHKLRHNIYNIKSHITIPKKWYYVLDDYDHLNKCRPGYTNYSKDLYHTNNVDPIGYGKRVLYQESMFNVVIENVYHKNWYNKIGDNFLTNTVPIYWGCPNISDFGYDERGIIRFENENDLLNIINNITSDLYNSMKPYIDYNFEIAKQDDLETRLGEIFTRFLYQNNIN